MKKTIKEFRIEIIAVLILLLGVFLVVERVELRRILQSTYLQVLDTLRQSSSNLGQSVATFFQGFSLSDLLGLLLLLAAGLFIFWRIRVRFVRSPHWRSNNCPKCGSALQRKHRSALDRLVGFILLPHSRRYRCANPACRWTGLRFHERRSHLRGSREDKIFAGTSK